MSLDHQNELVKPQSPTLDAFLGGRLALLQPKGGFRAGLDSVILGASIRPGTASVLDLGAGAGTAALVALVQEPAARALLVERDERVARKLVWRRPEHSANDEASFADFVERSFLARPWTHEATFSMAPLGNVSQIAPDEQIPRTLAGEWAKLATELRNDPGTLVDELIAAWTKRGQI